MFNQEKLYWIGIRESEIANTGQFFDGSITIFGSNIGNNYSLDKEYNTRINYNKESAEWISFLNKTVEKIVKKYSDCKFLLYYPMELEDYDTVVGKHAICVNSSELTDLLENKIYTKLWASKIIPVISYTTMVGAELSYDIFCDSFPNAKKFVIQGTFSCGGSGTWLVTKPEDVDDVLTSINVYGLYTVTPYKDESISVNVHLLIYEQDVVVFPASVQIINNNQGKLCYGGADYIMTNNLPPKVIDKVKLYAQDIGQHLQIMGYRGICGIDFLTTQSEVFFMEINARFQSSSFLINNTLQNHSLPSLQELHVDAFYNSKPSYQISNLNISQSFYNYSFHNNTKENMKYIWEIAKNCPEVAYCVDDDLDWKMELENDTYLFKLVFSTNIACVSPEYTCRLYNGFNHNFGLLDNVPWYEQLKRTKVLLLNLGIRINNRALMQLENDGGPNSDIFYAIDLSIDDKLFINVPYKVAFSELSPFEVDFNNDVFCLKYYNKTLAKVSVRTNDPFSQRCTQNNISFNEIAYLGVDRLRIHQRGGCFFKDHGVGCHFCDIESLDKNYTIEDIKEVIQTYKNHPCIRHYLVGGGSQNPTDNFEGMLMVVKYLHETTGQNIYLMSIPPEDPQILAKFKEFGVTEVAFNIEIYNRNIAQKYMPGKGSLSIERYEKAFEVATELWGKTGNVRSALIIGLEPKVSVIKGIEYLCNLGVSPILALLKPANYLENYWAPSSQEILEIWEEAELICQKYNVPLGPTCHYCEDNVLKATLEDNGI